VPFSEEPGEAAFYGPKIDFVVKDVIGREWQLGTVQVDYNLPERFDLESYIGADNKPHRPVMIHRAPFGSMERFVGVLIEHFAGAFPHLARPEQVRVLPISEKERIRTARLQPGGLRSRSRGWSASDTPGSRCPRHGPRRGPLKPWHGRPSASEAHPGQVISTMVNFLTPRGARTLMVSPTLAFIRASPIGLVSVTSSYSSGGSSLASPTRR
jgi:hypothetical protein